MNVEGVIQLLRIIVGFFVSFLTMSLALVFLASGATSIFEIMYVIWQLFSYSITCTSGWSLLIWIPTFWVSGFITLEIFGIRRWIVNHEASTSYLVQFSDRRDIQMIVSYIIQSRVHGASDQQILMRLRSKGWTEDEINLAFRQIS